MAALLSLIGVSKRYVRGTREISVLNDVSLDLDGGDFACVIGGRGIGKTTLLETAAGFVEPDAGRVLFAGRDLNDSRGRRRREVDADIACVRSRSAPWVLTHSVLDHVALATLSERASRKQARRSAAEMLERVGARDFADASVLDLSEGERTRVSLAQALVRSPRLLIADEVTDTLDLHERIEVLGILQTFAREGLGVLMTAADPHGAVGASRLMLLSGGRLVEPPRDDADGPAPADHGEVLPFRSRDDDVGAAG